MTKSEKRWLIGGGLVALVIGAVAWSKSAKAATALPPSPTPNTPTPSPAQPAPIPSPNQIPNPGTPVGAPSTTPPTSTGQPPAAAMSALVALWEYQGGKWVEVADTKLGLTDLIDPMSGGVDLQAAFAAIPQYKPNPNLCSPPCYQYVRLFTSDGTQWTQIPVGGFFKNY